MKKNLFNFPNILTGILYMLFILSFSVIITLNLRVIYYQEIDRLNLTEISGLTKEEIRENYDALIDYNSMFHQGPLVFPSLSMSEPGRIHFEEVKRIFVFVQYLCILSFLGALAMTVWILLARRNPGFLKLASGLTLAVPAVLGGLIALNWEQFFVTFHHIFFNNDYWIFDPATDPVITILPDAFFMHCAILILVLVVLGSILCGAGYYASSQKIKHTKKPADGKLSV